MSQNLQPPNPYIKPLAIRSTGFGYIVKKESYELQYLNPPLAAKLGLTEEEVLGKLCYETIFQNSSPCDFCRLHTTPVETSTSWYLHHEPSDAHYVMNGFLTHQKEKDYFVQMCTGITDEIKEIAILKESIMAEQMVTSCANTLTKGNDAMDELLQIVCDFYDASHACVWTHSEIQGTLRLSSIHSKEDDFSFQKGQCVVVSQNKKWHKQLLEEGYLFLQNEDLQHEMVQGLGHGTEGSLFFSAIGNNKETTGLLAIYDLKKNLDFLQHINTVKSFIANSLAMKNRIFTLQEQNELAHVVLSCVATLEGHNTFEEAIQGLLSIIDGYFQGDRAYILRKEVGGISLEFENIMGNAVPSTSEVNEASLSVINQWFEDFGNNDTLAINSVQEQLERTEINQFEYDLLMEDHVESLLGVRLYENGKLMRFLLIDNPRTHVDQVELLKSISSFVESHLDRGKMLKTLEHLSYTDTLTGLYNRNFYNHYLEHLEQSKPQNYGVIFADVNGLKRANDNFGHELGDKLLKWSGAFLKAQLGSNVFRIGGDEFVCFLEDISKDIFETKIQKLKSAMGAEKDVHISIGYSWRAQIEDVAALMKEVDQDMYQEKKRYYHEKATDLRSVQQELEDFKESIIALKF